MGQCGPDLHNLLSDTHHAGFSIFLFLVLDSEDLVPTPIFKFL